ncbi:MAG: hypothetical protein R3F20_11025 [Planctomycetota bacterium]
MGPPRAKRDGAPCFAKLFARDLAGDRRAHREATRARKLIRRGIATPALLAEGRAEGGAGDRGLFELVPDARDHRFLAVGRPAREEDAPAARRLFRAFGTLHRARIDTADGHLGNVLVGEDGPIFVDVGATVPCSSARSPTHGAQPPGRSSRASTDGGRDRTR